MQQGNFYDEERSREEESPSKMEETQQQLLPVGPAESVEEEKEDNEDNEDDDDADLSIDLVEQLSTRNSVYILIILF
jgi:hypothetical protein